MPRITVPERSTSETSPVARVKYHSAVPWDTNTDAIMGCSSPVRRLGVTLGPTPDPHDPAIRSHQPRREIEPS